MLLLIGQIGHRIAKVQKKIRIPIVKKPLCPLSSVLVIRLRGKSTPPISHPYILEKHHIFSNSFLSFWSFLGTQTCFGPLAWFFPSRFFIYRSSSKRDWGHWGHWTPRTKEIESPMLLLKVHLPKQGTNIKASSKCHWLLTSGVVEINPLIPLVSRPFVLAAAHLGDERILGAAVFASFLVQDFRWAEGGCIFCPRMWISHIASKITKAKWPETSESYTLSLDSGPHLWRAPLSAGRASRILGVFLGLIPRVRAPQNQFSPPSLSFRDTQKSPHYTEKLPIMLLIGLPQSFYQSCFWGHCQQACFRETQNQPHVDYSVDYSHDCL